MGVVHNSQQQQLFLQNLAALLQPQLTNQFITQAQILFQQQFAAAAAPVPKTPITKPFSARAFSSPNSIISASAPVRKLRDSLYQAKGSSLIDSQPVITKKLDKLLESCDPRALGKMSSDALASYQRRVVRLSSQLCGRVVCDLLIRVRPVHDIHIWHLLRNKGVEFTGTDVILLDGRRECLQEVVLENTIGVYSENWKKLGLRVDEFDENSARLFLERSELGALVTQRCQAQIREYIEPRGASTYSQKGQQSNTNTNSSKTKVSRVLQILYRAGCFLIKKPEAAASPYQHVASSRWLLKPDFWLEPAGADPSSLCNQKQLLRQQHDQLIVRLAHEVGFHLSPEKWTKLLRNDRSETAPVDRHKDPKAQPHSEMQSVVDKEKRPLGHWIRFLEEIINLVKCETRGVNQKAPPLAFVEALDALKKMASFSDRDKKIDEEAQHCEAAPAAAAASAPDFPTDCCESSLLAVQKVIEAAMAAYKQNWRLNPQLAECLYPKPAKNKKQGGAVGRRRHDSSFSLCISENTEEMEEGAEMDELSSELNESVTLSQGRSVAPSPSPFALSAHGTPFAPEDPLQPAQQWSAAAPRKTSLPTASATSAQQSAHAAQAILDGLFPPSSSTAPRAHSTSELPIHEARIICEKEEEAEEEQMKRALSALNKAHHEMYSANASGDQWATSLGSSGASDLFARSSLSPTFTPTPLTPSFPYCTGFMTAPQANLWMNRSDALFGVPQVAANHFGAQSSSAAFVRAPPAVGLWPEAMGTGALASPAPAPACARTWGLDMLEDGSLPPCFTKGSFSRTCAPESFAAIRSTPADERNNLKSTLPASASSLGASLAPTPLNAYLADAEEEMMASCPLERLDAQSAPSNEEPPAVTVGPGYTQPQPVEAQPNCAPFRPTQHSRRVMRSISTDPLADATTESDISNNAKQMRFGFALNESPCEMPLFPHPPSLARTCSHDPAVN